MQLGRLRHLGTNQPEVPLCNLPPKRIPFTERLALRMAEATQYSGLGRTSIYDAIRAGRIATTKVGKRRLVFRESLDRFLTPQP